MIPTITAFAASPDEGQGMARDMPVRWALEEAGRRYEVHLVSFEEMKEAPYRRLQPFGQIPAYEEGGLVLFESGAIVLHVARNAPGLLPEDDDARARAITWLFAALGTIEPPIVEREQADYLDLDKPWHAERLPALDARVRVRLGELARRLGDGQWLDGAFSAGDLMMVSVLRRTELLPEFPTLAAYVARAMERPAFRRAFAAQLAVFKASKARLS